MEDNFDSVQWRDDDDDSVDDFTHHTTAKSPGLNGGGPSSSKEPLQAGPNADKLDLAGVGRGKLETFVSDPQTESEGTKDAYVSYLVTTEVNAHHPFHDFVMLMQTSHE
jgi:sorting nexin-4